MRHARWCVLGKAGAVVAFVAPLLVTRVARAADIDATPSTLATAITQAQPGDTVHLAAGHYAHFSVANKNGTAKAWITISGPAATAGTPPTAIVDAESACKCNTIEITGSSYVAIENLLVDGHNLDGVFGLSAKGSSVVHDIRVEGCTFVNHHGSQQHDAISTKIPTWGWIIRNNVIKDAGTGIYLGNSDGTDPFIGGLIEGNVVENPIGYCMEIKYQKPRPTVAGMPTTPTTTIIRRNVFIKNDDASPDGDRPNLLVGGFPASGAGMQDRYEVYGNIFAHNPRESLFQASGRVTIHDNVFVDAPTQHALTLQNHDLPLELATVYNNTMYDVGTGIYFGNAAPQGDGVVGNLIFSAIPIKGPITNNTGNLTDSVPNATSYVTKPSDVLAQMDFYPKPDKCTGAPLDESAFATDTDYAVDFNGTPKGTFTYRGAYAGSGENPGSDGGVVIPPAGDGSVDGSPADAGGSSGDNEGGSSGDGCGCVMAGAPTQPTGLGALGLTVAALTLAGISRTNRRLRRR